MMKTIWIPIAFALVAAASAASARAKAPIEGLWRNPRGTAIIAIAPCGPSLCGKVAWASQGAKRDAARNVRKLVGTTLLTQVRRDQDGWSGNLYVPDQDMHVSAQLELVGSKELKLTGCMVVGVLCQSQIWTRASRLPKG